ncbi:MAG TPA: type IV pilus secretin PilQ [Deltaproteobacteria bacterium]|nr:type IV pilus secretin PilQ [Deltaproteobacteria bacterium]
MNKKNSTLLKLSVAVLLLCVYLIGCVSHTVSKKKEEKPFPIKRITAVTVEEDADTVYVWVKGNGILTYTSVKQPSPLGVILYLPETVFEAAVTAMEPDNDFIGSIKASKIEAEAPTSRIEIVLKQDLPYAVDRDGSNLKISFKKPVLAKAPEIVEDKPVEKKKPDLEDKDKPKEKEKPEPVAISRKTETQQPEKPAASFDSLSFEKLKDGVTISVKADGAITKYNAFTIESPARIVLDLYDLKSPLGKEKHVAIDTQWVKRIRYYGYPDRFRLVVDTTKEYLSSYRTTPFQTGIQIQVGGVRAEAEKKKAETVEKPPVAEKDAAAPKMVSAAETAQAAWVNRIDFTSEAEGKSAILIQTTRPVEYHIQKVADKQLQLKLFNTRIPDYRQRPLITTRFESAVDRITPFHSPASKETALVSIELREEVPFLPTQTDTLIKINFDASSVPPRPFEEAKLPAWKKALAQAAKDLQVQEPEPEPKSEIKVAEPKPEKKDTESAPSAPTSVTDQDTTEVKLSKFTGEKIALDFYETDIKNVFRILREVSGKNFAIDKDVSGKVTLSLHKPVPWDQVLDLVLRMNQLGTVEEDDIIRVATIATLTNESGLRKSEAAAEQVAKKQEKALESLVTEYFSISYANASTDILPHVGLTPNRGSVTVDERNNQIIITDTAEMIRRARETIRKIDQVTPQVLIEARVVEATASFSREIGTQWNVTGGPIFTREVGNGLIPEGALDYNISATNPPAQSLGVIGINFSKLTGTPFEIVNAQLLAAESQGDVNIISSPSILTLDNKTAKIKQGTQIPIPKLDDSGNTVFEYRDVDLELEVTPHVTPDDRIAMEIKITKNELGTIINNAQSFTTKEAKTELLVNNGDTVVIGGIRKSRRETGESGIPGLMKVPFISWLFKSQSKSEDLEELLIFITPKIIILKQRD